MGVIRTRTNHIQFWVNDKELKRLNKNVERCGLSREAYLRHLVNGIQPIERPSKELLDFIKELHSIGNNINQIAMRLHSTNQMDELQYKKNYEWLEEVISNASKVKPQWL